MPETVIRVDALSKCYTIRHERKAHYATLRDTLMESASRLGRRVLAASRRSTSTESDLTCETLWALRDVSFEVRSAERLGIIGRNGAGKSTLLRILSRITEPTTGKISIRGRVASLLEVGTGFHPELTGRENIYLNGAVLGMGKAEIKRKFDEIVAFSEVERFLDTPLKRYSSGMSVRLAFAVAAHLDPEILVVDEVLAVGDVAFQKKCLGKMHDTARSGRTVVFVSHDMGAINTLCERAMLLHAGSIMEMGSTRDVVARYLEGANKLYSPIHGTVEGNDEFRLISVIATQSGKLVQNIDCRQPFTVELDYEIVRPIRNSRLFVMFRNAKGEVIFGTSDFDDPAPQALNRKAGRSLSSFTIPGKLLKAGPLYGTVGMDVRNERVVFAAADVLQVDLFDPESDSQSERHQRGGTIAPLLAWNTTYPGVPASQPLRGCNEIASECTMDATRK